MRACFALVSCAVAGLLGCTRGRAATPANPEGTALIQAYVRAWNAHDSLAVDTLLSRDGTHEDLAQGFSGGGRELRGFMRQIIQAEPDFHWQLTAIYPGDSMVAAEWTWSGTYTGPTPSGPVVNRKESGRGASIALIRNHRIARFTDYYDASSFFAPSATSR